MKALLLLLLLCTLTTTAGAIGMPHRSTVLAVSAEAAPDETVLKVMQEPAVFSPNWWSHSLVSRFLNWMVGFFGEETFGGSLSHNATPLPAAVLPQA